MEENKQFNIKPTRAELENKIKELEKNRDFWASEYSKMKTHFIALRAVLKSVSQLIDE